MDMIPRTRPDRYLLTVVLGLICLSFLNMLYCTMAYEFGWGPMTFLAGPEDRFADVIKLSLSFRSVTAGIDKTERFQSWKPIYQDYYKHPVYEGKQGLANGELTHFHHPPLSTLIFLLLGIFIVGTGRPPLVLLLCFLMYLLEVWSLIWIGIPREKRTGGLTWVILFLCLASYPVLLMFGRANYVNAGLTTIPVIAFLLAVFSQKRAGLACLTALAIAVNVHPNAIIFLLALPLAFGIHQAVRPVMQFIAIALAIFAFSYLAAHRLYPDYTIAAFRHGVAIYGRVYIENGGGIKMGSSLYGLVRVLNHGFHMHVPFWVEVKIYYVLTIAMVALVCAALWRSWSASERNSERHASHAVHCGSASAPMRWPLPLVPFFLVSLYCILSPIFADYHLLVFLAPLILAYFEDEHTEERCRLLTVVAFVSILMLSPKNYPFRHESVQVILNPVIVCGALLWLTIALLRGARQPTHTAPELERVGGR